MDLTTSEPGRSSREPPTAVLDAARKLFGDRLDLAQRYAELLATDGVVRGLIGPREAPRIWDRHLLNCVVVAELIPRGARVTDVGSGGGLPGIVLAIARPDLTVTLVEPLARRTAFLDEVIGHLRLDRVSVVRARAEDAVSLVGPADIVVARAVAPLDRLAAWCLPLTVQGGHVLALKGESAAGEVDEHREAIRHRGGGAPVLCRCGVGVIEPPATVVDIVHERAATEVRRAVVDGRRDPEPRRQTGDAPRGGSRRPRSRPGR